MADDGAQDAQVDADEDELRHEPPPTAEEEPMGAPTPTIFESAVLVGAERLDRTGRLMLVDGVIAGLYISFGVLASIALYATARQALPDEAAWALGALLYPVGYMFVIIGQSELFTENFLTPILAAWHGDGEWSALWRLWGITFVGNLAGIALMAALWSHQGFYLLTTPTEQAFREVAVAHLSEPRFAMLMQAVFAGMLVNFMSWLVVAVRGAGANAFFIFIPTYILLLLHLDHSITGTFDVFLGLGLGAPGTPYYVARWVLLTAVGNMLGGLLFVTGIHALQLIEEEGADI